MELMDRYLQAVRFFLPRNQQDDIVRELTANLLAQMEEREEGLGRPLTEDEQAAIIQRHGHPMVVAGRYLSHQHLIGPLFLPLYWFTVKAGLGVALLVVLVEATVAALLHGDPIQQGVRAMLVFPGRALMVFAWTTLVFAALDFAQARMGLTGTWNPRSLPKVFVFPFDYQIPRRRTVCELVLGIACLIWLLLTPTWPVYMLGPAAAAPALLVPAPIWQTVYGPIVALTMAMVALSAANVMRPYWSPARSAARVAIDIAGLVVLAMLLRGNPWFVAGTAAVGADGQIGMPLSELATIVNMSVQIGIVAAGVIKVVEIGRELRRVKRYRPSLHAGPTPASTVR
jgi:hypothetical protein